MTGIHIAGYDGTPSGRAAVDLAEALAAPVGARVVAAAVFRAAPHVIGKGVAPHVEDELNAEARAALRRRLAGLGDTGIERVVVGADSVPRGLHELAEDRHADLIVVGRTHRHWPGRLAPGSTAERLVHGAPCPVASVPAHWTGPIATVGVAFDGGEESWLAVHHATGLAQALSARLLVLSVFEPVLTGYGEAPIPATDTLNRDLRHRRERTLDELVAGLPEELDAERLLVDGTPAARLETLARDVDLLVVGSRGYGPLRAVLAGSTSRHVLDHAPCPVIVVPRAADPARQRDDRERTQPAPAWSSAPRAG